MYFRSQSQQSSNRVMRNKNDRKTSSQTNNKGHISKFFFNEKFLFVIISCIITEDTKASENKDHHMSNATQQKQSYQKKRFLLI